MISIVICSIDAQKFNAAAEMYGRLLGSDIQVIRVADAKSLAEGYNRGIKASTGEVVILAHDDVEVLSPDLAERLQWHLARFDMVGVAGTSLLGHPIWLQAGPPYIHGQVAHVIPEGGFMVDIYSAGKRSFDRIQAMDGLFLAMHRRVADTVPFDEQTFDGFHLYDMDFTFRAYQAGFRLGVAADIHVLHNSAGNFDEIWKSYAEKFVAKHQHRLSPLPTKKFFWMWATVAEKGAIREAMTPVNWD